jgi:hypothetical protein
MIMSRWQRLMRDVVNHRASGVKRQGIGVSEKGEKGVRVIFVAAECDGGRSRKSLCPFFVRLSANRRVG